MPGEEVGKLGALGDELGFHESRRFEVITFETPRAMRPHTCPGPISMGLSMVRKISNGAPLTTNPGWVGVPEAAPRWGEAYLRRAVRSAVD